MKILVNWVGIVLAGIILAACAPEESSSDDDNSNSDSGTQVYSGITLSATVGADNKDSIAKGALVGSQKAIVSAQAPRSMASTEQSNLLNLFEQSVAPHSDSRISTRNFEDYDICGAGNISVDDSNFDSVSGIGTFTITYNDCAITENSETTVYDGTASFIFNEDGTFSITYNMKVTVGSDSTVIAGTYSCDSNYACGYQETFSDGNVTYKVENPTATEDNNGHYAISVRVYHEDHGYVDISATGLILCANGGFSFGTISVTDGTDSVVLKITFENDCTTMNVEFEGSSTKVTY